MNIFAVSSIQLVHDRVQHELEHATLDGTTIHNESKEASRQLGHSHVHAVLGDGSFQLAPEVRLTTPKLAEVVRG